MTDLCSKKHAEPDFVFISAICCVRGDVPHHLALH